MALLFPVPFINGIPVLYSLSLLGGTLQKSKMEGLCSRVTLYDSFKAALRSPRLPCEPVVHSEQVKQGYG